MTTKPKPKKPVFTQWGDPVLSMPTKAVSETEMKSPKFKAIVRKMFKMIQGIGVGLAANQIGLPMRFAVVDIKPNPKRPYLDAKLLKPVAIVNPQIFTHSEDKQRGWEGCLSCPGEQSPRFYVERSAWIDVLYIDGITHERVNRKVTGFEAIVFQHEIDHLDGRICGERVMVQDSKVVPGAIITADWYLKTKGAPPKSLGK